MSPGIYGVVPIKTLLFTYVVLSRRSPRQEAHLSHEYKSLDGTDHYISYRCTVVTYNPKDMFKKRTGGNLPKNFRHGPYSVNFPVKILLDS